jgi:hypothetical protein
VLGCDWEKGVEIETGGVAATLGVLPGVAIVIVYVLLYLALVIQPHGFQSLGGLRVYLRSFAVAWMSAELWMKLSYKTESTRRAINGANDQVNEFRREYSSIGALKAYSGWRSKEITESLTQSHVSRFSVARKVPRIDSAFPVFNAARPDSCARPMY